MNEVKKQVIELNKKGFKVSRIAKIINKSKSTIYRYLQQNYDEERYPSLKCEIKNALLQEDFKAFINKLSYKDISLLRRNFKLSGYDKESKIKAIIKYFKDYSLLGLYPENINRETIKKAFFKKAKQVHPDANKELDKSGKEFQEVYQSYNYLMARA